MTHEEFSSRGGKAHKGTEYAKERAKKAIAGRWRRYREDKAKEKAI